MVFRLYSGFLAVIFLCGCAILTTPVSKLTDTIRNSTIVEKSATIHFSPGQSPSTTDPNLKIRVVRHGTYEETFQRRYIEKRILKPNARVVLWISGAAFAFGGYYVQSHSGWVRLGQYVTGLGAVIPLSGEIITPSLPPVGEEWREESRTLPPRTEPASGIPVSLATGFVTWQDTTDSGGQVTVDVAAVADSVPYGQPLELTVALAEDTTVQTALIVPVETVDAWRTPPVVESSLWAQPDR